MIANFLKRAIEFVLKSPMIFELQQKYCNNYENVRDEFSEYFLGRNQKIIDIGCSTGTGAGVIFDMRNNDYVGVDISPDYISVASARYPLGKFYVMDARKLDFESAAFDLAVFNGVLHHMDDELILDCMREVKRVLKPGGKLLVAEPVFTGGKVLSNFLLSLDRGQFIRSAPEYRQLLMGFQLDRERFFNFSAHRFCSFVASVDTGIGKT